MKKFSLITVILILSLLFTACTNNEVKLYNAFLKAQDITSMENDTKLNFTFEFKDFPEEVQQQLDEANKMLKDLELNTHMKQIANKDKTKAMVEMTMNMNLGGIMMDIDAWSDVNLLTDEPKMITIVKMPQLLMSQVPSEDANKEYIVYDYVKMMDLGEEELNFNELMSFSKDINEKVLEFMKDYHKNFDPEFKIATYKGKKAIDGKVLSIYEVKLNDESFKELTRYVVNNAIENQDYLNLFKEYIDMVLNVSEIPEIEKEQTLEEINEDMEELKENLPELKDKFNKFMDTFKNVKILGKKGIIIEYAVNSDGYIVRETGNMDINIDLEALKNTFGEETPSENTGTIKLEINFDSKNYNINEKIEINMPKLNKENSILFEELLEQNINQIEEYDE